MSNPMPDSPEMEPLTRTQVLIAMGLTAVVLLLIAKVWLYFAGISVIPVSWDTLSLSVGLSLGVGVTALSALAYRLWPGYSESADAYLSIVLRPLSWPDLIWLGILPGMSEELLFRGVMFPALGMTWLGLVVSSLCFGLLHLTSLKQWPYVLWASSIGAILAGSVWITGNLLVPIAAHALTNIVSSSIWKWNHNHATEGS